MDVERLHVVLQQSFSPDAAIRKPAEDTMRNLKNVPGSVQLLLQVIAEKQVRPIWSESPQERKIILASSVRLTGCYSYLRVRTTLGPL
jgi:hypothetical protein